MKKKNGTITIEAAVVVPLILMVFYMIMTLLFYYHDKNVVSAITHEALVMNCGKEEIETHEVRRYIEKRIEKKMFLFENICSEVEISDTEISITCSAKKNQMLLNIRQKMRKTDPKNYIWRLRRIHQMIEGAKGN